MSPPPLLVHVGYHKTATTWLQGTVFQPENGFRQVMSHDEIFDQIITPHGLIFDPEPPRRSLQERRQGEVQGVVDVISLEALSGNPITGGRESDDYARRLADIVPGARILITIREQIRIIASVYMQYLVRAGTAPPGAFFDGAGTGGYFGFDPVHFEYHRLVGLYQSLFGPENVCVLPLELIASDQAAAVNHLAEFSGNRLLADWTARPARGVSYPETAAPLLRRANYFRRGPMNPNPIVNLGPVSAFGYRASGGLIRRFGRKARKPVTDLARARFGGCFADSNRQLRDSLAHPVPLPGYEGLD